MTAIPRPELPTHGGGASGQQRQRGCKPADVAQFIAFSFIGILGACLVLSMGGLAYLTWSFAGEAKQPRYHVAVSIDGVTGLDPSAVLGPRPTLDPEFNLTVGLASRSFIRGSCFHDGSAVRVYYGGVQLAREWLPMPSLCVGPWPSTERASVVAWGIAVRVPRCVRGALARDLRRGAAEFNVALTVMKPSDEDGWQGVTCKVKLGQATACRKIPAPYL